MPAAVSRTLPVEATLKNTTSGAGRPQKPHQLNRVEIQLHLAHDRHAMRFFQCFFEIGAQFAVCADDDALEHTGFVLQLKRVPDQPQLGERLKRAYRLIRGPRALIRVSEAVPAGTKARFPSGSGLPCSFRKSRWLRRRQLPQDL